MHRIPHLSGRDIRLRSLNNRGQFVGDYRDSKGITRAFICQQSKLTYIPPLPQCQRMMAMAINDSGQVVGYGEYPRSPGEAVAYLCERGKTRALGPSGSVSTYANDINNAGLIVGYMGTIGARAVVWKDGLVRELPSPAGDSFAYGVNERGDVLGAYEFNAAIWRNNLMTKLNTIRHGEARSMNDEGLVAGWAEDGSRVGRAFLRRADGSITKLGVLSGFVHSKAGDINRHGTVVGKCATKDGGRSAAFLWTKGKMYDVNSLVGDTQGWLVEDAVAINDRGEILVTGSRQGRTAIFLLQTKI